jgi:hypothetical protein
MEEEWDQMHRITACKVEEDYKLWLRFEDGLEGSVFLGNLLEIGAFQLWRASRSHPIQHAGGGNPPPAVG